jgi:hypothetical protein
MSVRPSSSPVFSSTMESITRSPRQSSYPYCVLLTLDREHYLAASHSLIKAAISPREADFGRSISACVDITVSGPIPVFDYESGAAA